MQTAPTPHPPLPAQTTTQLAGREGWWTDLLLENFVRKNPLFLFSAAAVLLGAWLLNPPGGDGSRDLFLLLRLFAVIQVYQGALIGAALLLRPRGTDRELRYLLLVLAPFLIDVTFTNGGVIVLARQKVGLVAALGLLTLALLAAGYQLVLGLRIMKLRLGPAAIGALALGPLCVLALPLLGLELAGLGRAAELAILSGCGVALLVGCLAGAARDETVRRLAPGLILGVTAHALATAWVYQTPAAWVLAPPLLALGLALPSFWPRLVPYRAGLALALPGLAVCVAGVGEGAPLWRPILLCAALIQVRTLCGAPRSWGAWAALALALDLAVGGASPASSFDALGATPLEPLALFAGSLIAIAAGLHPRVSLSLGLGALVLGELPGGIELREAHLLRLQAASVLAFAAGWRRERSLAFDPLASKLRLAGALGFGLAPACALAWHADAGHLRDWLSISGALLLLVAVPLRSGVLAGAALPAALALALRAAPRTESGWGVLSLAVAFACVGAGLAVSRRREQLLALLAQRAPRPRSYSQASLLLALGVLCVSWTLAYHGAHDQVWRDLRSAGHGGYGLPEHEYYPPIGK